MKSMPFARDNNMPLYAVVDTNVLVSAFLKENSVPRSVVNNMYAGNIIPIYNEEIIAEYSTVLHRPKFCFPAKSVDIAVHAIQEIGIKFNGISVNEPMPDPKDIVFYAVTLHARQQFNAYLITGNIKHFPEVPFVITPHQALDILADKF
ncbi:putative toxin-antitoxin system toxin component, PIN family [Treponema sp. OMZ 838]|uniref:PIN domain-containing protein n=2 Tax=Treponema TaxID=157 RepID=UPI00190F10CF|nr:PIN domain-containing protein [Treponema sp. OMZ 855]